MPIKLITLNLEGDKHLDLAIPFLEKEQAEVVFLQEVFEADLPLILEKLKMNGTFAPMSNMSVETKYGISQRGKWGIALLTSQEHSEIEALYYKGAGTAPTFTHPYDNDQVMLVTNVKKDGVTYTVANTHFTWSPDGHMSCEQSNSFELLKVFINRYPDLVLAGDFNAPRGREMFAKFTHLLTDNLPEKYTTTIDKNIHYAGDLQLVVDTIFSKGKYEVLNVRLADGVSDHMAVVGEISIKK